MNPDELKDAWNAWKAQTLPRRLTVDAELLLKEVQRNQKAFSTILFWRDLREIRCGLVMVPVLFFIGWAIKLPWTFYLMVPAILWIVGFILVFERFLNHCKGPLND